MPLLPLINSLKMNLTSTSLTLGLLFGMAAPSFAQAKAPEYEFLHWWTSKGETRALEKAIELIEQNDISIAERSVLGGGGDPALTVLQTRVLAGNMPDIALVEGVNIQSWAKLKVVFELNDVAETDHWQDNTYPLVTTMNSTADGYIATPLNIHRMNWMWVNQALLTKWQAELPSTWEDFLALMTLAKQHNVEPLAIGNAPWQVAQLFENIVLSIGGSDLYYRALVKLDPASLSSPEIHQALDIFRRISLTLPLPLKKRSWSEATLQLAQGEALMQVGGDWILGELMSLDIDVPSTIACISTPGTQSQFLYNMDSIVFLKSKNMQAESASKIARILQRDDFQLNFNRLKGSIPVRKTLDISSFNVCQQQSKQAFESAIQHGSAVPSMSDSMALNPDKQKAFNQELYRFFVYNDIEPDRLVRGLLALSRTP